MIDLKIRLQFELINPREKEPVYVAKTPFGWAIVKEKTLGDDVPGRLVDYILTEQASAVPGDPPDHYGMEIDAGKCASLTEAMRNAEELVIRRLEEMPMLVFAEHRNSSLTEYTQFPRGYYYPRSKGGYG